MQDSSTSIANALEVLQSYTNHYTRCGLVGPSERVATKHLSGIPPITVHMHWTLVRLIEGNRQFEMDTYKHIDMFYNCAYSYL